MHDLSDKKSPLSTPEGGLSIIALPVFGGRIPAFVAEKLKHIRAEKKKAATIVVYGNRAYEDALLELNNIAEESGFEIVASGAFVAQHSMCPEVGEGRPDEKDFEDIKTLGKKYWISYQELWETKYRCQETILIKLISLCLQLPYPQILLYVWQVHYSVPYGCDFNFIRQDCNGFYKMRPLHGVR